MVADLNRGIAAAGAAMAALGVALGAFGAHLLKGVLAAEELGWWETAVQYQMWHALALVALGTVPFEEARAPAAMLGSGALLFSGTLYAMALGGPRWLGALTPIGGGLMIAGWVWLALRLVLYRTRPDRVRRR
jgi:uncharacterized membrane protein YgdD (TMEM256/DUF423 family)